MNIHLIRAKKTQRQQAAIKRSSASFRTRLAATALVGKRQGKFWR